MHESTCGGGAPGISIGGQILTGYCKGAAV